MLIVDVMQRVQLLLKEHARLHFVLQFVLCLGCMLNELGLFALKSRSIGLDKVTFTVQVRHFGRDFFLFHLEIATQL